MVIPAGFAQCNVRYTGTAAPTGAEWVLGVEHAGTGKSPLDVGDDLFAAITSSGLMANFCNTIAITSVLVKFGPDQTGPSAVFTGSLAGSQAGPCVTPNTTILARKITALGGRAGRGRTYLPGPREQDIDQGGAVVPAVVTQITADLNEILAQLVVEGLTPVLLHGAGSPITTPTPLTDWVAQPIAATQRRRLRR